MNENIENKEQGQTNVNSREIDFLLLAKKIWKERKLVIYTCMAFAVLGVIVALNTPKAYTTSIVLAPESTDPSSGLDKLGSIGSMFGVKLGASMSSDAIYPELYPDILASTDFQVTLFNVPVKIMDSDEPRTYAKHLVYDAFIPFWAYPRVWISRLFEKKENGNGKELDPFWLTKPQVNICGMIKKNITCIVDKKTGAVTISVTDQDRLTSAIMADTVRVRLQRYITDYRTQKARHDLEYMTKLYEQSKAEYLVAQQAYARASDSNLSLIKASSKAELTNLENEMELKYQIYSSAMQQLQLVRERIQENTPAFTTIQGATVPLKASSFPRSMMVIVYVLLGFVCSSLWIIVLRDMYYNLRKRSVVQTKEE